ncbi:MAG: hypothetical protein J6S92_14555 [Oscillospiraceae bacterium]|nr:hypothetical protein [Oscillospiraceae bacterium]
MALLQEDLHVRMTFGEIAVRIRAELINCPDPTAEVSGFSTDTRTIAQGNCFIALKGENFNGNAYAKQAAEKGAVLCILSEQPPEDPGVPYLIAAGDAYGNLAESCIRTYKQKGLRVVGVTGSSGKTTVKDMTAHVLAAKYRTYATSGNHNNHVGVPYTILHMPPETEIAVIEMGMNHAGEILHLSDIAEPDMAIITNIGTAHIGNLGSQENIFLAKTELIENMPESGRGGTLIVPAEDEFLHGKMAELRAKTNVVYSARCGSPDAELLAENIPARSYIGRGGYGTITPAVIRRNMLENPVWYTSYTPYQAEVSQGRLEALFVFQTMVSDLTGLPLANCSLLDEATAAAESVTMMRNLRSREQVKNNVCKVFVDEKIWPNTLSVLRTRAAGQGIEIVTGSYADFTPSAEFFGALVQWPNSDGSVEDYECFIDDCHEAGLKVTVVADLLALALLKPLAADIMCGTAQRFGLPMGFGGPTAGYMATRDEYKRDMPGRIIGLSKDKYEHPAYRLALQTREQHIKRERATSNICTAEALSAMMAGMYGVYHGAEGIRQIAEGIHAKATYLNEMLQAYGYALENAEFFDTLKISIQDSEVSLQTLREKAEEKGINLYYAPEGWIGLSIDETVDLYDMNDLITLFAEASGNLPQLEDSDEAFEGLWTIDESRVRDIDYMQAEVFQKYHTETELMRYLKRLDRKDISLATSMIPLG